MERAEGESISLHIAPHGGAPGIVNTREHVCVVCIRVCVHYPKAASMIFVPDDQPSYSSDQPTARGACVCVRV